MEVTSGVPEQHDARRWQIEQYGGAKNITADFDFCCVFFFFSPQDCWHCDIKLREASGRPDSHFTRQDSKLISLAPGSRESPWISLAICPLAAINNRLPKTSFFFCVCCGTRPMVRSIIPVIGIPLCTNLYSDSLCLTCSNASLVSVGL